MVLMSLVYGLSTRLLGAVALLFVLTPSSRWRWFVQLADLPQGFELLGALIVASFCVVCGAGSGTKPITLLSRNRKLASMEPFCCCYSRCFVG